MNDVVLTILEDELPPGMVGDDYNTKLTAKGVTGVPQWELVNPYGMPSGLNLDKDTGTIAGIPDAAAAGTARLIVKVTDSGKTTAQQTTAEQTSAQKTFSLTINPALRISRNVEPGDGSITLKATGGAPPYTWTTVGKLPDWLKLSSGGVITIPDEVDPKETKAAQLTVKVTDNAERQHNAQISFSTMVRPTVSWWRRPLHPGRQLKASGLAIKFRSKRRVPLGQLSQLTFWLAFLALAGPIFGNIPIFVYSFTTPGTHGTYLGVSLLTALAAFLAGCLIGFLFGIPRAVSSGQARLGTSSEYTPSSNLAEVSDWLTKLLLGAGLVQLTHLGTPISHLIGKVAAGLHSPGAYGGSATVMAGAIMFGYVTIGLLDGYVVTTIWYQKKLASLNF
jgi:hypothetical protein